MSHGPSTLGTMITSSLWPISVTTWLRSSRTQGLSRLLTRVQSAVSPRSASLATLIRPWRAASLRSTGTASSRLPSRMSVVLAMSGALAAIFSFEKSRKWIIREGLKGTSRTGSGAQMASGSKKWWGVLMRPATLAGAARSPSRSRGPNPAFRTIRRRSIQEDERKHDRPPAHDRPGGPRGIRRAPLRALPRGVRGRRHLQALAGQDGHRGGRPPLLPHHDEPPPAAHQRRLCGGVAAGAQRRSGTAGLFAGARHDGGRRVGQGDREPGHRGPLPPGSGLPRRHPLRRVRGAGGQAVAVEARPRRRASPHSRLQAGRDPGGRVQACRSRTEDSGRARLRARRAARRALKGIDAVREGGYDAVLVGLAQMGIEGQRQLAPPDELAPLEPARGRVFAELADRRVKDAGLDVALVEHERPERLAELGALERDRHDVARRAVHGTVLVGNAHAGDVAKALPIAMNQAPAPGDVVLQPREAGAQERGPRLVDAVVVAQPDDVVARGVTPVAVPAPRRHRVRAQPSRQLGHRVLVGGEQAALAAAQHLV